MSSIPVVPPNNANQGELESKVFIGIGWACKVSKRRSIGAGLSNRLIGGRWVAEIVLQFDVLHPIYTEINLKP